MKPSNLYDHIRLLAAALVLYSHHYAFWGLPEPQAVGTSLGGLGVGMFFVLSGFLVSNSLLADPNGSRFMARRALRIMPGLFVNVLLCAVVLGALLTTMPLGAYFEHPQFREYFLNVLFQPRFQLPAVLVDAPVAYAVNGSLWTLPFEILAYLVLALIAWLPRLPLRLASPALLLFSLAAMLYWKPAAPIVVWGSDLRHLPLFMAFFFAGSTLAAHRSRLLKADHVIAMLCLWVLVPSEAFRPLIAVLMLALVIIHFGSREVPARYGLGNDCSYGVYLYAAPVQQACIHWLPSWGFWPTMALAAAITYGLALLSWKLVEKPSLGYKPRRPAATA